MMGKRRGCGGGRRGGGGGEADWRTAPTVERGGGRSRECHRAWSLSHLFPPNIPTEPNRVRVQPSPPLVLVFSTVPPTSSTTRSSPFHPQPSLKHQHRRRLPRIRPSPPHPFLDPPSSDRATYRPTLMSAISCDYLVPFRFSPLTNISMAPLLEQRRLELDRNQRCCSCPLASTCTPYHHQFNSIMDESSLLPCILAVAKAVMAELEDMCAYTLPQALTYRTL